MRIVFDGKLAAEDESGQGKYGRFLIESLARRFPDASFDIYMRGKGKSRLLEPLLEYPNVGLCRPELPLAEYCPSLWERHGMVRELERRGTDVYHGLDGRLPSCAGKRTAVKYVLTVHDLAFLYSPDGYSWAERHRMNLMVRSSVKKADMIVADSGDTARDIVKYYFIPKERITAETPVCPEDCDGDLLADRMMSIYRRLACV